MNISQEKSFKPITITLETKEEAIAFIKMIDTAENNRVSVPVHDYSVDEVQLAIKISNYFTENVNLVWSNLLEEIMIIIDRSKDIYDYLIGVLGRDETVVFNREKLRKNMYDEFKCSHLPKSNISPELKPLFRELDNKSILTSGYDVARGSVGFLYIGGVVIPFIQRKPTFEEKFSNDIYFTQEDVPSTITLRTSYISGYYFASTEQVLAVIFSEKYINDIKTTLDKIADVTKNPVFILSEYDIVDNFNDEHLIGLLSPIKGIPMLPEQIYQNIAVKLGSWNVDDTVRNVNDKDLSKQKGFDDYSFKKMPTKHKK